MAAIQTFLQSSIAFVLALGVIIFIHELGHLLAARAFNVRVEAFSLGFGKRIWGFHRGETDYRLSLIPLGGYVKLGGEFHDEASEDPRDFVNKPRWQRIIVYLAGPAMNFVLAWVVITGLFTVGVDNLPAVDMPPVVSLVAEGSPAEQAGLESGDRIVSLDGEEVTFWQDVDLTILTSPGRPLPIAFERDDERIESVLTPETLNVKHNQIGSAGLWGPSQVKVAGTIAGMPAEGAGFQAEDQILTVDGRTVSDSNEFIDYIEKRPGEPVEVKVQRGAERLTLTVTPVDQGGAGKIGANIGVGFYQRYPLGQAMVKAVEYNVFLVKQTFDVLGRIVTRKIKAQNALAGPIEIADMAGQALEQSPSVFLHLLAFISVSIAIVNLLPVPILDGGQTLILIIESIIRRDLSMVVKERLAQAGMLFVLLLMATVIFFDIQKRL